MNILFVNDIPFNPIGGGIERVTDILTKELVKRGYTIYYLCDKLPDSKLYLLNYAYPAKLFQLPHFGMFDNDENISYYKQLQDELKIDVVVNQRGSFNFMNCVLDCCNVKTISVVHTIIDGSIICYFNSRQETLQWKIKNWLKRCIYPIYMHLKKKQLYRDLLNHYLELVNSDSTIVVLSKSDANKLCSFIKPIKPTVKVIGNPCDTPNKTFDYSKKRKIILFVGRLCSAEKQPLRLVKIWNKLHKLYPDWKLVFVGDGAARFQMERYIKKHKISRVVFEGTQTEVDKYYKNASFVCLTSNYEGWGMALTEGMRYGCIPFTFNNYGAASDIIDDGINGCLIPAYNLKEYASRLSELMSDDDMRSKMSMAAIEKVKIFSVKNVANKWDKLFLSLLK